MPSFSASDGTRLHYSTVGSGPVLVLHLGAGGDARLWERVGYVAALRSVATCVLFDHRGHGESDRPRGWTSNTVDRYATDVLELLDELGAAEASCWAYSSGIDVALRLAEQHPERVAAVIGTGAGGPTTPADYAGWARGLRPKLAERGWDVLIDGFDRQEGQPIPDWMKGAIRGTDLQQFQDWLEALEHTDWTYWDLLPNVPQSTLFLVGEREDPDDETALAVDRMPSARRHRLRGAGHIESFIDAGPVIPVVREFLGGVRRRAI